MPTNINEHYKLSIFEFLKYFSNTWLLGKHGAGPEIWNVSEDDIRTNNIVEGYHSKINKVLANHSKISNVIPYFKDLFSDSIDSINKISYGKNITTKIKITKDNLAIFWKKIHWLMVKS